MGIYFEPLGEVILGKDGLFVGDGTRPGSVQYGVPPGVKQIYYVGIGGRTFLIVPLSDGDLASPLLTIKEKRT